MSFHFFYSAWTRTSAVALTASFFSLAAADAWWVQTALIVILALLLVTGSLLVLLGLRDLVRDLRHMLEARSHNKGHA